MDQVKSSLPGFFRHCQADLPISSRVGRLANPKVMPHLPGEWHRAVRLISSFIARHPVTSRGARRADFSLALFVIIVELNAAAVLERGQKVRC